MPEQSLQQKKRSMRMSFGSISTGRIELVTGYIALAFIAAIVVGSNGIRLF